MLQNRAGRLLLALVVLIALVVTGRNLYRRYLNSALVQAVETTDAAAVRSLLDRGADPNMSLAPLADQKVGDAVLARVIHFGPPTSDQEEIACLLLSHGANPQNAPRQSDYLTEVCFMGSPKVLRCLLEKDREAIPRFIETYHRSPIQNAINFRNVSAVGFSGYNARVNELQKQERQRISRDMVDLLLAHGAHLTLLQAAQLEDRAQAETLLKKGAKADQEDVSHTTALSIAATQGDLAMMHLLMRHGANVNHKPDDSGLTPLDHAASAGKLEAAQLLLTARAQVHPGADYGTPLDHAITGKNAALVRLLLSRGANPNFHGSKQSTSGSLSNAIYSLPEVVPDLLQHGANINGLTAAISSGHAALARELMARGADVNAGHGSPLMAALNSHQPELARELLRRGAKVRFPPEIKPASTAVGKIQQYPYTPMIAAVLHAPECLEMLHHAGADINVADGMGETALTQAIVHAPTQVPWLLEHGVKVQVTTQALRTPLYLAVEQDDLATLRLLLAHGAEVNARPPQGHTALYRARKHNQKAAAELLEKAGGQEE